MCYVKDKNCIKNVESHFTVGVLITCPLNLQAMMVMALGRNLQ